MQFVVALIAATSLSLLPGVLPAAAQGAFPERPIRLVVGYPPGGSADVTARLVAPALADALGQPVVVENRGGATGAIGAQRVAAAPPDGYTLLFGTSNEMVSVAQMRHPAPYDSLRDFTPIGMIGSQPGVLLASPRLGVRTPSELIDVLRSRPGRHTYGTPGVGSAQHLAMELLQALTGTSAVHVPYPGAGPLAQDLLAGNLDLGLLSVASGLPLIRSGRLVAIGTTSAARTDLAPDVPALAEHPSLHELDMTAWMALFAPAKLPPEVRSLLQRALQRALSGPTVRRALVESGTTPNPDADLAIHLRQEAAKTARIIGLARTK